MTQVGRAAGDRKARSTSVGRVGVWSKAVVGMTAVFSYFMLPSAADQNVAYVAIGAGSTAAMLVAVLRNRPAERGSWYLLTLANAA
jgi:phosphoribosylcarboxyaminoimidazole (NCAIR) mutase